MGDFYGSEEFVNEQVLTELKIRITWILFSLSKYSRIYKILKKRTQHEILYAANVISCVNVKYYFFQENN